MRNRVLKVLACLTLAGCGLGCNTSAIGEDVAAALRDSIKSAAVDVGAAVVEAVVDSAFGE